MSRQLGSILEFQALGPYFMTYGNYQDSEHVCPGDLRIYFWDIFKFGETRDHLTRCKPLLIASSYALARENTTAYLSEYLDCTQ